MNTLLRKLKNIKGKKIAVIGDIILDKYIWGDVSRISPEAPVPIVSVKKEEFKLGSAANVSVNIKKMGADPYLIGLIGSDINSKRAEELLNKYGISDKYLIKKNGYMTILKERIIALNQQILRIDYDNRVKYSKNHETIMNSLNRIIPDAVIIADYNKGLINAKIMKSVTDWCNQRSIYSVADPHPSREYRFYLNVNAITPNFNETHSLLHLKKRLPLEHAAKKLNMLCRNKFTLLTLGAEGMLLYDGNYHYIPTRAREVYDVTGAGDTVVSIFALALVSGYTPIQAAQLANFAASYVVTQIGVAACTKEILTEILKNAK